MLNNKIKEILKIFSIILGIYSNCQSQCIEQQDILPGHNGPNLNSSFGQQIRACQNGKVTSIAIHVETISGFPVAKLELYKGSNYDSLIWSSGNVSPTIGWWEINVNNNYNFVANEIFSIRWWNLSSQTYFYFTNMTITNPYPFGEMLNHFGNQVTDWDYSFKVGFNATPLPIIWSTALKAIQQNNSVFIGWGGSNQLNNDKYIIEHAKDGTDFTTIGEIDGDGTNNEESHYDFTHKTPSLGINNYRIKQIDYDGTSSYSNIASAVYEGDGREIAIYPNPATDEVTVSVTVDTEVSVVDMIGRVLKKQIVNKENNRVDVTELPKGIYIFTIGSNNIQRLIKQ